MQVNKEYKENLYRMENSGMCVWIRKAPTVNKFLVVFSLRV